jgi:hypothetical protein
MQPCSRMYYSKIYWRLNMFRAAYRSSSGAPNCIYSLWFIHPCGVRPLSRLVTTWVYKPEVANRVWCYWWWAACRSKLVEPSINFGIINSITRLHLFSYLYWFILRRTDQWILNSYRMCVCVCVCVCVSVSVIRCNSNPPYTYKERLKKSD